MVELLLKLLMNFKRALSRNALCKLNKHSPEGQHWYILVDRLMLEMSLNRLNLYIGLKRRIE